MIPVLINALITFVVVFLANKFIITRSKVVVNNKALQAAIVAIMAVFVTTLTDVTLVKIAKPNIFIKTHHNDHSIEIQFQIKKSTLGIRSGTISSISLEYPVTGVIEGFRDHNSITQAQASAFVIGDSDVGTYLSHLELLIENIEPNSTLTYTILYRPAAKPPKIQLQQVGQNWPDCYKMRYVWNYRWDEFSMTQWRLVENDHITDPPQFRLWAVKFSKSPKYPGWIPKRRLK